MRSLVAALLAPLLLLSGCGGDAADKADQVDLGEDTARVEQEARDVVEVLSPEGVELERAEGVYLTCRSEPSPGVAYDLSVTLRGDGTLEEQLRRLVDVMVAQGWSERESGPTGVSLLREDDRASAGASRRQGAVALTLRGACVDTDLSDVDVPLRVPESIDLD